MPDKVKILCVDDENNVLRALRRVFLNDDYEIISALSAEAGLEILRTDQDIQIVISDYRMPDINGVDFLKEVCLYWPDTVRIVLSGYADTAAVVAAINDGQIFKFIAKPWDEDELRATIQKAIKRYHLKSSSHQRMNELAASNQKLSEINEDLKIAVNNNWSTALQEYAWLICQDILKGLPISVVGIDAAGYVVHCNDTARKFLNKPETEVLGSPWTAILPEILHPFVEKLIKHGVLSEPWRQGERSGLIKGKRAKLGIQNGLILTFDLEEETGA